MPPGIDNPFFRLFPSWAQLPMVVPATAATVIASQAVISGAFSLSRQAMQLGLLLTCRSRSSRTRYPDLKTSEYEGGQVFFQRSTPPG